MPSSPEASPAVTPMAASRGAIAIASNASSVSPAAVFSVDPVIPVFLSSSRILKMNAFSGTSGAAHSRKYARSLRRLVQSMRVVSCAPRGAESMAEQPRMAAAAGSTHPPEEKFNVDTAAVLSTAIRDVPVTIRE